MMMMMMMTCESNEGLMVHKQCQKVMSNGDVTGEEGRLYLNLTF